MWSVISLYSASDSVMVRKSRKRQKARQKLKAISSLLLRRHLPSFLFINALSCSLSCIRRNCCSFTSICRANCGACASAPAEYRSASLSSMSIVSVIFCKILNDLDWFGVVLPPQPWSLLGSLNGCIRNDGMEWNGKRERESKNQKQKTWSEC